MAWYAALLSETQPCCAIHGGQGVIRNGRSMPKNLLRQPNFAALVALVWLLVALRCCCSTGRRRRTLFDTDDAMRLASCALGWQDWFDLHQARMQPPEGYDTGRADRRRPCRIFPGLRPIDRVGRAADARWWSLLWPGRPSPAWSRSPGASPGATRDGRCCSPSAFQQLSAFHWRAASPFPGADIRRDQPDPAVQGRGLPRSFPRVQMWRSGPPAIALGPSAPSCLPVCVGSILFACTRMEAAADRHGDPTDRRPVARLRLALVSGGLDRSVRWSRRSADNRSSPCGARGPSYMSQDAALAAKALFGGREGRRQGPADLPRKRGKTMGKVIGIDLGTTNSCVAVMEGKTPRSSRTRRACAPRPRSSPSPTTASGSSASRPSARRSPIRRTPSSRSSA